MNSNRAQHGFTLIEVMLAMGITVIVAIMAFQGLDSAMQLSESEQKESDNIQRTSRVLDILGKDFRQIVPRVVRDPTGNGYEDAFFYNSASFPMMKFSRNGWTNPQPTRFQRSQLQRVHYHFDGKKLIRTSFQAIDRLPDEEGTEITLLDDVRSFEVKLLTSQTTNTSGDQQAPATQSNGIKPTQWVDMWPAQQAQFTQGGQYQASNLLPMAIEIEIDIEKWGKLRRVFELAGND
ncbi:Type II secretion system protein J [BD1-7 clade bacterium]|uniref:Type II secretion system protein J n=1 Tax=BD1-7 clade bacterium TaxID=2029982 RepID=A0A5S9QZN2_9GAMM|nr:Type II secretion system protein J [BD1-7 clade bacterium]CAA0106296.1 Type II secretion system protein J [BD1-7 clade bacterium]CAA0125880.1 Type II secretion system protein J [BD1-7 clade bacterium]